MRTFVVAISLLSLAGGLCARPLPSSARSAIPKDTQQIICVDYRALKASPNALALKDKVLPADMKQYDEVLRSLGLDPDKDLDSLAFVSFRTEKGGLRLIGIAEGQFPTKKIYARFKAKKIVAEKYPKYAEPAQANWIFPGETGFKVVFLDDSTMLFGDDSGVKAALDVRDGDAQGLVANSDLSDAVNSADNGPVWSVLDQKGTQTMLRSALGQAGSLADFEQVKKRLLSSRYYMDFTNGMNFELTVVTSDPMTAATLSTLMKAGVMVSRNTAKDSEKAALENVTVDSDSSRLKVHFKANDNQFQSLLKSSLFASVTH